MAVLHYQPRSLFEHFNSEINRHMGFTPGKAAGNEKHDWTPVVDIREEKEHYLLTADIPGVERNKIEITLEDGVLTLKGERSQDTRAGGQTYRRRERAHGAFLRKFSLPDTIDSQNISATVKDGVLDIVIPKQSTPQPKRIAIN